MRFRRSLRWPAPMARMLLLCLLAMVTPACTATPRLMGIRLRDAASRGDADAVREAIEQGPIWRRVTARAAPRCYWRPMATTWMPRAS